MGSHFHTPSLGDESFDLSGIDETVTPESSNLDQFESKRMRSMEENIPVSDEPNTFNTDSNPNAATTNKSNSGIFNITAHLHNNANNSSTTSAAPPPPTTTLAARKQMAPSSTDPNEPPKPLSPYTLFFRDTVSTIKQQNPNCPFQELTRIVSSMWETLDTTQKDVYNKKTETARNEYVKQLRIYRQQQQEQPQQQPPPPLNNEYDVNNFNQTNQFLQEQQVQTTTTTANFVENTLTAPNIQNDGSINPDTQIKTITSTTTEQSTVHVPEPEPEPTTSLNQMPVINNDGPVPCIRDGCSKHAVMNPDWEDEYCSNECVVIHCRHVFNNWVQQNREAATVQQ